jgi:hypothetical protein
MERIFCFTGIMSLVMTLTVASYSCAGRYLRTESATPREITGTYTLILYGGNYANAVKNVAILARQGTPYTFDIFAPSFDYKVIKNAPAREALEEAEKFLSFHPDFWKIRISEIVGPQGGAIGYEVIPLYYPTAFGYPNIIRTYYRMTGDKVIVYIRPHFRYPALDIPFEGGGSFGPR